MSKYKLNISFDCFTLQKIAVTMIIRKCVEETLKAEGVTVIDGVDKGALAAACDAIISENIKGQEELYNKIQGLK